MNKKSARLTEQCYESEESLEKVMFGITFLVVFKKKV